MTHQNQTGAETMTTETTRRTAIFLNTAADGYQRLARRIWSRAVLRTLGHVRHNAAPYYMTYAAKSAEGDARYLVDLTDAEFERLNRTLDDEARDAGWTGCPFDAYHD